MTTPDLDRMLAAALARSPHRCCFLLHVRPERLVDYVAAHTVGLDRLRATVQPWTPEAVAAECGVAADDVRRAAQGNREAAGRCRPVGGALVSHGGKAPLLPQSYPPTRIGYVPMGQNQAFRL